MNETGLKQSAYGLILAAWAFALEYSLYLVGDDFSDKLIKLGTAFVMLVYFRYRRDADGREKVVVALLYFLLLTTLPPSMTAGDFAIGVSQWTKIALMTTVFPMLLVNERMTRRSASLLLALYVWFGILFSIQAVLAFCGVLWGVIDTSTVVEIGRRPDVPETTMGLLGFANAIRSPTEYTRWLRPQGWFLEPSLLGAFLLLPVFVSLGRLFQYRKGRYLLASAILVAAMLLTASFAAYLGFVAGMFFLLLSKPLYNGMSRMIRVFRFSYPIVILGGVLALAIFLMALSNGLSEMTLTDVDEGQAVLTHIYARDPSGDSGNLLREVATMDLYASTFLSNPFGIGFAQTAGESDINAANGLLFWAVAGGFPALVMLVVFFCYVFYSFCHPLLISGSVVNRCIAASFIGHAMHNLSYGNWIAPYFLIHLVIVCIAARSARERSANVNAVRRESALTVVPTLSRSQTVGSS